MKITKTRIKQIIKEETRALAEEDGTNIQRVTDIDQMVKNFLTTAHWTWGSTKEEQEEEFRENIGDIAQFIINGEVYHYFISQQLFVDSDHRRVTDDKIWAKISPTLNNLEWEKARQMKIPHRDEHSADLEEQKIKLTKTRLMEIIKEELEAALGEETKRTAKGNITQDTREKYATVGKDKFPIFDKKSAEAAIDLRGHAPEADREKIINKAAKYAPAAAKKAREEDK